MSGLSEAEGHAVFSPDGAYRYMLSRVWDTRKPILAVVMLNPSIAGAEDDDPTVRRVAGFAKEFNCGGFVVVNLYAYVATDPNVLGAAADPVGPDADIWIRKVVHAADAVLCAWGANKAVEAGRVEQVLEMIRHSEKPAWCLGVTKSGAPKHPLYLRKDTPLQSFPPTEKKEAA